MKKVIGVILIIAGLAFLTWKVTFSDVNGFGVLSISLNILAFFVMAAGWTLMKIKSEDKSNKTGSMNNRKTQSSSEKNKEARIIPEETKNFEKSDHSRFMPK